MSLMLLAINWMPQIRGYLTVLIGVVVLMGSIFLILSTNMGVRLGFLVTFAAFAGWMMLMGAIWWINGIGLKGDAPSWIAVPGQTVIQQVDLLHEAGVLKEPIDAEPLPSEAASKTLAKELTNEGWRTVDPAASEYGQAQSAATVFLTEEKVFEPGQFAVTNVYEIGGEAFPKPPKVGDELDFVAFWHHPYYTLVEVAPYVPLRTEPGRAPTAPEIDTSMQRQYVYMVRDLGSLREPAGQICIGSGLVFFALCWLLNRRDRIVAVNLSRKASASAA